MTPDDKRITVDTLKIVCASDFHFGDPRCSLVTPADPLALQGRTFRTSPHYEDFRAAVGTNNDYLILLGDVFDFAVTSYEEAYSAARAFFQAVARDKLAKDVIYVPGNHDSEFWHLLQYEVHVVKRVRAGKSPRALQQSVAAVIDDRPNTTTRGLWLETTEGEWVSAQAERARPNRDGIFLDRIFADAPEEGADGMERSGNTVKPEDEWPRFWLAYPNLYLVTRSGECILFTHGHYFQAAWSYLGEFALGVAEEDLAHPGGTKPAAQVHPSEVGPYVPVGQIASLNFPISQLLCSGIGQAGPLTNVVREVQNEVQTATSPNDLRRVRAYYDRLPEVLARGSSWRKVAHALLWLLSKLFRRCLLTKLSHVDDLKTVRSFLTDGDESDRVRVLRYFLACRLELQRLNLHPNYQASPVPSPNHIVFGHTHNAISWAKPVTVKSVDADGELRFSNGGGWLKGFGPGEVFKYADGKMTSVSVAELRT